MNSFRLASALFLLLLLVWLPDAAAKGSRGGSRRARSAVKAGVRRVSTSEAPRGGGDGRERGAHGTPEAELRGELAAIWAGRALRRGVTAIYVVDARTGDDIYAVHADDKLNPASNVKLVSTATVLDLMGPDWQYVTRLYGPTPDPKGVARGDLYLHGNADPTLTRAALDDIARSAARAGLKRVEGRLLLGDDVLRDTVAAPRIDIRVQAGERPGSPAVVTIDPADSFVRVQATAVTTADRRGRLDVTAETIADPLGTDAAGSGASWDGPRVLVKVAGTIGKGRSATYSRNLGMRSTFTGYALRQALRAAGIEVAGGVRLIDFETYGVEALAAGFLPVELGRHRSRSMQELVARVNKRSLNALADRLLMTAGAEARGGGAPSLERGIEAMYRWLDEHGLDRKEIVVDSGSGLSHRTKLTARHLVRILRSAAGYIAPPSPQDTGAPASYVGSLAVGGVDGTLRGRFRSEALRGRVFGKTGTLNNSIALSGFVSGDGGDSLCFAIVTNGNRHAARGRVRQEHEQMVAAMKRYLDARRNRDASGVAEAAGVVQAAPDKTAAASDEGSAREAGEEADDGEADEASEGQSGSAAESGTSTAAP